MLPKGTRGYHQEGPERSNMSQGTLRDHQKASKRASGSALEALWTRLERHWGVLEVVLRGDLEPKTKTESGNGEFLKSMLSPRREHRFWGPEGPKTEPRTHPERSCEYFADLLRSVGGSMVSNAAGTALEDENAARRILRATPSAAGPDVGLDGLRTGFGWFGDGFWATWGAFWASWKGLESLGGQLEGIGEPWRPLERPGDAQKPGL